MRAIVQDRYGPAGVLELREVDQPEPADDQVLIEVCAASLHAGDYFLTTGVPYLMRLGLGLRKPRKAIPGFDVSGTIAAVGTNVTEFQPGDEVFGEATDGSCAEYVVTKPEKLAAKPDNLPLDEAATIATSGIPALRGIRDAGKVKPGDKVLVNGAAGGVGTYATQIAEALGAEVTGVCSTGNVDLVRSLGADHVIDYTKENFIDGGPHYDVILDNVGNYPLATMRRALTPRGRLVPNSGRSSGRWFGPLGRMAQAMVVSLFNRQQAHPYFAPVKKEHLLEMKGLIESGKVTPVVGKRYTLAEAPQAMADIGVGHSRGKVIIEM